MDRYPIGKFQPPAPILWEHVEQWIDTLALFPEKLHREVDNLSDAELERRYRPGGWTIRQVVNHCADSHINSFIRFKLAATEDNPTIKPYHEDLWAELPDSKNYPIADALKILEGVHARWVHLIRSLEDLDRTFFHPDSGETVSLKTTIGLYAWHGEHHLAHIRRAKV